MTVYIITRIKVESIKLNIGEEEITSKPYIQYLDVPIGARFHIRQQVDHMSNKTSVVINQLSRLMSNVRGSKFKI